MVSESYRLFLFKGEQCKLKKKINCLYNLTKTQNQYKTNKMLNKMLCIFYYLKNILSVQKKKLWKAANYL